MIGGFQVGPYQLAYQQQAVTTEPHGVIVRRGKTILWPDWVEEQKELQRVEDEIRVLEKERDDLLSSLRHAKSQANLYEKRIALAHETVKTQATYRALLARLSAERKQIQETVARQKRMRDEIIRIREDEEDVGVIALIIGDFYD